MYYKIMKKENNKNKYGEISSYILEQKKSKFISYIFSVTNEYDAKKHIDKIKEENKDARHVVYIYSILSENKIPIINFSDDGEPQGTGTKAIYELLTKESITNVCIVIVRYFGGILLGAGPLSRAYLNSAKGAILLCKKEKILQYINKEIKIEYNKYDTLINALKELIDSKYVVITNSKFNEKIIVEIKIEENYINRVEEIVNNISH